MYVYHSHHWPRARLLFFNSSILCVCVCLCVGDILNMMTPADSHFPHLTHPHTHPLVCFLPPYPGVNSQSTPMILFSSPFLFVFADELRVFDKDVPTVSILRFKWLHKVRKVQDSVASIRFPVTSVSVEQH